MDDRKKQYGSTAWRHLPSDKTMNEFRTEYQKRTGRARKPSDDWMRAAIHNLDLDDSPGSIYEDLFSRRLVPGAKEVVDESTTYPRLIAWEVSELISILLEISDQKKRSGEACASAVLDQLAERLLALLGEDLPKDFIDTKYLTNPNIRHRLLCRFEEPFRQRLQIIHDAIFGADVDVDTLMMTLERLDIIIASLQKRQSVPLASNREAVRMLYGELLSQRANLLPPEEKMDSGLEFYRWASGANSDLIAKMEHQIRHTKREPSETEVRTFLDSYQEYLNSQIPLEVKQEARLFWRQYAQLDQYFYGEHDVEEFEKNVREELYAFARDIFVDLSNQDNFGYSYSYYVPSHAVSAYARTRLADIHRDIQIKIHQPIRILRSVYAYLYFTAGGAIVSYDGLQKQMTSVLMMRDQIHVLSKCHSESPMIDLDDVSSLEPYLVFFREQTQPVLGEIPVQEDFLRTVFGCDWSRDPELFPGRFTTLSDLLKMECQLVVSLEVEKAIKLLTEEYTEIKKIIRI